MSEFRAFINGSEPTQLKRWGVECMTLAEPGSRLWRRHAGTRSMPACIARASMRNWAGSTGFKLADARSAMAASHGEKRFAQGKPAGVAASDPVKKNGADLCESNGATPPPPSHPMQGLISD